MRLCAYFANRESQDDVGDENDKYPFFKNLFIYLFRPRIILHLEMLVLSK